MQQELKDKFEEIRLNAKPGFGTINDLMQAAYNLAIAEKWVSVNDRLPECVSELGSECVLVYTDKGMVMAASYVNVGNRLQWEFTGDPFMSIQIITHWMPLPQPPIS